MQNHRRWLPAVALVVLTLTWGYTWVLAKQGLQYAPPFAFAAERCVGGALALIITLKLLGKPLALVAPGHSIGIGLTQVAGMMVFQTWALVEGGPGKTAALLYTMPIWTLLLSWPLLGERVRGKQWLAAVSTLAGLLLIIEPWNLQANLFSKFLGVIAAICWASGSILVKRLRAITPVDLLTLSTWQMIFGAIPVVVLSLVVPEPATDWNVSFVTILAVLSIASTAMCWYLWIYILDRLPAWEASLSILGTPIVAILSSRWTLGEQFKPSEIGGIVLIGSGLALLSLFSWAATRIAGNKSR